MFDTIFASCNCRGMVFSNSYAARCLFALSLYPSLDSLLPFAVGSDGINLGSLRINVTDRSGNCRKENNL